MTELLAGIDLGGTYIKFHFLTLLGETVLECEVKTPSEGPEAVVDAIAQKVREFLNQSNHQLLGIGIGVPGTIDNSGRMVLFAPNLQWRDVPFADLLTEKLQIPVFMENDANAAALGEYWLGSGQNVKDFICVTIGTGIGGGIFVNGKLLTGRNHNAAEIGHMIVEVNGHQCGCGNHGCWEKYASTQALVNRVRAALYRLDPEDEVDPGWVLLEIVQGNVERIEGRQIIEAVRRGDPLACQQLKIMIHYLAVGLSNLIFLFNPEKIILAGGITASSVEFLSPLNIETRKMAPAISCEGLTIEIGKLGHRAGALGAARLALQNLSHSTEEM